MTFSSLSETYDQPTNRLYEVRDARIKSRQWILDLASGNVNTHGIAYPAGILRRVLKGTLLKTNHYHPDPLGQAEARDAISEFYRREGVAIPASQLVLTPGTSISYWYCFKLLANPGDEILCPTPSYPLFESIASLSAIQLVSYPLIEGEHWSIDLKALESKITARTRAIVLISPHNPTGAVASVEEVREMMDIAARHGLAIIHDEVFSPFVFNQDVLPRPTDVSNSPLPISGERVGVRGFSSLDDQNTGSPRVVKPLTRHCVSASPRVRGEAKNIDVQAPLVLTLNGFSKMFALAGLKIGWIGVTGEPSKVKKALKALEMISDTFLPVNEWAQAAVPAIFEKGSSFLQKYRRTIAQRSVNTVERLQNCRGLSVIKPEGGFFMTVRLNQVDVDEEAFVVQLLNQEGILVHPGFFYDMAGRHFVMTTVARPEEMNRSLMRIERCLNSLR